MFGYGCGCGTSLVGLCCLVGVGLGCWLGFGVDFGFWFGGWFRLGFLGCFGCSLWVGGCLLIGCAGV